MEERFDLDREIENATELWHEHLGNELAIFEMHRLNQNSKP